MLFSELVGKEWKNEHNDFEISGIAYDSRKVKKNYVFVCIKGFEQDGHKYAKAAEENGAAAIIAEDKIDVSVPVFYTNNSRRMLANIAIEFYGHPSKKFGLIGVTGTNGKTTVTYLIKAILEAAGKKVGIIGTNNNIIGDKVLLTQSNTPTTPNSLELQQLFDEMAQNGAEYVVMEVSSHALELDRVYGCEFGVGVFTNITQDHLDFHKTMGNYLSAKAKLFSISDVSVINIDDDGGRAIAKTVCTDCITVGIDSEAMLRAENVKVSARGTDFTLKYDGVDYPFHIAVPGKFSAYNAVCAVGAALCAGVDIKTAQKGIGSVKGVLGRAEVVKTDTDYTVLIDYAHTPDGLENIISTVKDFAKGRVITLFGCGGDRDSTKRPIMGEIAGKLSDYCVITSDNPRTEDAFGIIADIEKGIKKTDCEYKIIENRREAIAYALKLAQKDDVIILAGKGQETYQIIGREKFDFDEREVVRECLEKV